MRGWKVERRFGWDCHGLPVEMEAEQRLGITGSESIEELGIAEFNAYCRSLVGSTVDAWKEYVTRQARWVSIDDAYRTVDEPYMESVMWALSELWKKGLLYEGSRVLPYCWECETPLSNFETRLDDSYRDRPGPRRHRHLHPRERRPAAGVDHHAVDPAVQSGHRRGPRHGVRRV